MSAKCVITLAAAIWMIRTVRFVRNIRVYFLVYALQLVYLNVVPACQVRKL